MIVKNHMSKPLILQAKNGMGGLVVNAAQAAKLGRVVIPPGQARDVPFWDTIKNHPYYQKKLADGKITTGRDGDGIGIEHDFSSFGDTLKPPPNLDQNSVENDVNGDSSLETVDLEKSLENASAPRRRGRKPKVATPNEPAPPESVADLVKGIAE